MSRRRRVPAAVLMAALLLFPQVAPAAEALDASFDAPAPQVVEVAPSVEPTSNPDAPTESPLANDSEVVVDSIQPESAAAADAPEMGVGEETKQLPIDDGDGGEMSMLSGAGSNDVINQEYYNGAPKTVQPRVDETTGALRIAYPIAVPPGRNGMAPDLSLEYNSQRTEEGSFVGYGWALSIPSISRINRYGIEKLYTNPVFTSDMAGELVETASNTFLAKVENGDFLRHAYSSATDAWVVTDKRGVTYSYGSSTSTRQDDSGHTKTFKWMLDEMRDTNGNFVRFEYTKVSGEIYPSRIVYTGFGSTDGPFVVEFTLEDRPDDHKGYRTGFSVESTKRLSQIDVRISGNATRRYVMAYTPGDNGQRSLLASVTETGYDESGTATTLPAQQFGYLTAGNVTGWSRIGNSPAGFTSSDNVDTGRVLVDVNGDGLTDKVVGIGTPGGDTTSDVYINPGDGTWPSTPTAPWEIPLLTGIIVGGGIIQDPGSRFADVNGDGLIDALTSVVTQSSTGSLSYAKKAYLNTGSGWMESATWVPPVSFIARDVLTYSQDNGARLVDLNGDGLTDISLNPTASFTSSEVGNYYNNGSGWTKNGNPILSYSSGFRDVGTRTFDVNGDGLTDYVSGPTTDASGSGTSQVYLNQGTVSAPTWSADANWMAPVATLTTPTSGSPSEPGTRWADLNGDGLVDAARAKLNVSGGVPTFEKWAYLNTGSGWAASTPWQPNLPFRFTEGSDLNDGGTRIADLNGDGIADLAKGTGPTNGYPYSDHGTYANQSLPELLSSATSTAGGVYTWGYRPTPSFKNGSSLLNPALPTPIWVVATSTKDSRYDAPGTTTYSYEGGTYWKSTAFDRKFSGFNKIVVTDPAGNTETSYNHQGDASATSTGEYYDHESKIGKRYRRETRDALGNLFELSVTKWDRSDLGNGRSFVNRARETTLSYEGDGSHKDKTAEYAYDSYGNVTSAVEWGEVTASGDGTFSDTGTDKRTTQITYVSNATRYLYALPQSRTLLDSSATRTAETRWFYDDLAYGSVDKGNATKEEYWVSGSTYVNTEKAYNTYGLVTQTKDPRDKAMTYAYDALSLYPITTTNALSHVTQRTYDYSNGQPKETIDPNLLVTQTLFDGLDRTLEEKQPDQSTSSTLVVKSTYTYEDTAPIGSVKQTDWLDGSNGVDRWTYFDGFRQPIQTRIESEATNTFAVSDSAYDSRRLLLKESLPYFSSGSSRTSPTATTSLYTTYAYDTLRRPLTATNAVGTTSYAYDDWKTSITNPRSNVKRLFKDAYDRLVKVEEVFSATTTHVTQYEYDTNNNLTKITDALSNVRNFGYDGLGRRLTAQDLHAAADGTYGTWTYTFDDAGNPVTIVDPKSQSVSYAYDDLNRPLTEDLAGQAGTEAIFSYDACPYGKGKLCVSATSGATTTKEYGSTGFVVRETKTISGVAYQTDYAYGRQGNVLTATLPDGSSQKNTYAAGGQIETVERKESGDASWTPVVTNFDWSPVGKPTLIDYANSASTTNTYDATKLYRLTAKSTAILGGTKVQDIAYVYDANVNITDLQDASDTAATREIEYAYDTLDRLASAGYTTQTVLGTPLDTAFLSGPASVTWSATETLSFASNDVSASFECRIDSGSWSSCTSPKTYTNVTSGTHTAEVRAVNGSGTDSSPASRSWSVVTTPLNLFAVTGTAQCLYGTACQNGNDFTKSVTSTGQNRFLIVDVFHRCLNAPTATYNGVSMTETSSLNFMGNNWVQFELTNPASGLNNLVVTRACGYGDFAFEAAAFEDVNQTTPVGTRRTASGTSEGSMSVTGTAGAGDVLHSAFVSVNDLDLSPNPPLQTIVSGLSDFPAHMSAVASASGSYATSWTIASQGCCAYWGLITTPVCTTGADLDTWFRVLPSSTTWSTTATFEFASHIAGSTFQCQLDAGGWTACASPKTYTGLSLGGHSFSVRAISGQTADSTPAEHNWTIVTTPPSASPDVPGGLTYIESYAYDAVGNLLTKAVHTVGGSSATSTYAYGGDQGASYANPHAATTVGGLAYSYDNNGNLTSSASGTASFAWDFKNRMTTAVVNGATSTYAYDHGGSRVLQTTSASTTAYVSKSYSITNGVPTKHLFADDLLVATVEGSTSTAVTRHIHTDHLTGSSVVTSASGTAIEVMDYYPYGGIRVDEKAGAYSEVRKFAGHEFDDATDLSYMGARYYDGGFGRFLSQDPVFLSVGNQKELEQKTKLKLDEFLSNPQIHNSYSYVANNPLKYIDENGEFLHIVIGAGVGMLGQYAVDVGQQVSNNGWSASAFVPTTSPKEYALRGFQGAAIAATGGLASGAVGVGLAAGATAAATEIGVDVMMSRSVDWAGVATTGVITTATAGLVKTVPRVPGRLPNFGTKAFAVGKHAQQSAAEVGIDFTSGIIQRSAAGIINMSVNPQNRSVNSIQKSNEKKDD